jgi:hypothetical protein
MPVEPSASRSAIQSDTLSFGLKHSIPVSLRSSDAPPGSGLTNLNPTIGQTKLPHSAPIVAPAGFVIFGIPGRIFTRNLLHMISTEFSSLATQNTISVVIRRSVDAQIFEVCLPFVCIHLLPILSLLDDSFVISSVRTVGQIVLLARTILRVEQGGGSRADCFPVSIESDDLPCPDFIRSRSHALFLASPSELPSELVQNSSCQRHFFFHCSSCQSRRSSYVPQDDSAHHA